MSPFHSYRWNHLKVIPVDSRVSTGNDIHRRIVAERLASACSLHVTLQTHSRGGGTTLTLRYCSASSKFWCIIISAIIVIIN